MFQKYCILGVKMTFIFRLMFRNSSEYAVTDNPSNSNFFCLDDIIF